MAARFGLTMLATTARGDVYTFADLSRMHEEAGFRGTIAYSLEGPQTVVVATR
jgi:hypothetical protein